MERFLFNLKIAFDGLRYNKMRSLLTALGIIFGVASVIAMQAIGKGTEQDLLEKLKLVGVNNIIISQKTEDPANKSSQNNGKENSRSNASLGLNLEDGSVLKNEIPVVVQISPETDVKTFAIYNNKGFDARLIGVAASYFNILSRNFESGNNFDSIQISSIDPVCILSAEAKQKLFHAAPAIGQYIRCDYLWLKVTGVLAPILVNDSLKMKPGGTDNDIEIYMPVKTLLLRYNDRSFISKELLNGGDGFNEDDNDAPMPAARHYNQVDKLIVQVKASQYMTPVKEIAARILQRRHAGLADFEIKIPEADLKQEQDTKDTFNLVLGIIAGISLLVGGIGIMNIMLVSVTERTKEIGLRLALGARKKDVVQQFLSEAILLSSMGGVIGVLMGILVAKSISGYFHIITIFTFLSLAIAFTFSIAVGLIFGLAPAKRAARQNPIESLRYE